MIVAEHTLITYHFIRKMKETMWKLIMGWSKLLLLFINICSAGCEFEMKGEFTFLLTILTLIISAVKPHEVCEIHATIIRRVENEGFHRLVWFFKHIITKSSIA